MGLLATADLPSLYVFLDQGQFEADTSSTPEPGTEVSGGAVEVSVNDLLAADGIRSGPAVGTIRRAVVYVSRDGLASQSEMDVVNYLARRLGESSGVTSWDRYPSFAEATGGAAAMTTDIRRRPPGTAAAAAAESVRCAKVGVDALVGIELDEEFGGCLTAGTSVEVSGVLNLTDENYYAVCLRLRRYGAPDGERIYACDELNVEPILDRRGLPRGRAGRLHDGGVRLLAGRRARSTPCRRTPAPSRSCPAGLPPWRPPAPRSLRRRTARTTEGLGWAPSGAAGDEWQARSLRRRKFSPPTYRGLAGDKVLHVGPDRSQNRSTAQAPSASWRSHRESARARSSNSPIPQRKLPGGVDGPLARAAPHSCGTYFEAARAAASASSRRCPARMFVSP